MKPKPFLSAMVWIPVLAAAMNAADLRSLCQDAPKYHTEVIEGGGRTYRIQMGGRIDAEMTRDPVGYWAYDQYWEPNVYVRLENIGDVPVVNPWLRRADRPDTRSTKSIVDFVITPSMSDAEKARRVWEFEIRQRFHATTEDDEVDDVVKRFNCYGYTLCGNESKIISDLWRAAGLRVRRGFPNGHSTAEVFYDGAWHLLDSDEHIIAHLPDNKTIASEAQVVKDHFLMKRVHSYGPLHDDNLMRDETGAALHFYEGERSGEQPSLTKHKMDFTLRPGEAITWAWKQSTRFHGKEYEGSQWNLWNKRWRLIANVMNGEMTWMPDLTKEATLKYFETSGVAIRESGPFGRGLYLTGKAGSVILPVATAYPVVGGRLEVDFSRRDQQKESVKVSISFDKGKTWKEVWTNAASDYARMYIDLNEFFPPADPARYHYLLRFDLSSEAAEPAVVLKGLYLQSTLQMARLALPCVSLGDNTFIYTNQSAPGGKVKITHAWSECSADVIPGAPAKALYPPDGGAADGTKITFRWEPPTTGAPAADYELMVAEYPDMRWAISGNFHKLISRTANRGSACYELPWTGLLNPGETYYWRVRARSAEGVWGPWSKVFSFTPSAPAVPANPSASFDPQTRSVTLSWEPGQGGTPAVRYRVYGSSERGFTPSERPYKVNWGVDGIKDTPPNLLMETEGPNRSVVLPPELWRPFYRVAAVDAAGRLSGTSAQAELRRPLIMTSRLPDGKRSLYYQAQVEVAASIGHLVSANMNGRPYHMKFRNGDELKFELAGAPQGLSIDPNKGLIAGHLPASSAGKHELTVTVTDQRTGSADTVKLALNVR